MATARTGRLRLAYCHNGTSTYDQFFLSRLAREYEAYLITFGSPNQVPTGVRTIRLRDFGRPLTNPKLDDLRILFGTLWRAILMRVCLRSLKPDIVVGCWVTTYGLYSSLSRFRPFVLFVYGSDVLIDPQRSALHKWITTRIIRLADLVLVDSEVQRSAVISLGAPPKKIVSFPWVDSKDFLHTMPDLTLRDGLDWGDNVVVVSTRMHEAVYAVDTLIRAIPIVAGRCPNVRFLLFGAGAQTTKLIDLARELKVEEFVHFAGLVERNVLLRYLSSCDMYVSTALSDGTSSSLLEAMSLGVPVVVTRSRGNLEWVTNHYSGLLFDKRDYCELAKAIVHLACDPEEAVRLTQNAKKTIARRVNSGAAFKDLVRMMSHAYSECRNNR